MLADDLVPCGHRQLAGNHDRSGGVAVLDDFHQMPSLTGIETVRSPVIEDQQLSFGQASEEPREAAVGMSQFKLAA